jgi:serine/threonine protein kinase/WD40 repeat protein
MNPDAQRVRDVFVAALDVPPEQLEAFLKQSCAGDEALRRQVSELLQAHERPGSFLDQPIAELRATRVLDPAENGVATASVEGPVTVIGPYKLLELIGEGGMGEVWMAEQREPMHRRVALKIIKAGMDTRSVVARFEAERQALALMDHPNIAMVFDAGATESGRPYFVMELVKGTPIARYCDEHRLTLRERLELFVPVCQAIQHAHQKGIIHRDIKPSNVLIAPYDGRPVPKIIDFGVARAMGQRLTERTLYTGFGSVVGTLEYMSPEQAELNNQDIDTRSDIYTLGVLLYELLTGTTPLSHDRVIHAGFVEMLRAVREEDPPRPSARISTVSEEVTAISAARHTDPARLRRTLRRDLDWIVMKSLAKDRTRRYQTANDLVRDLEHFLHNEPVEARPPSLLDRAAKWSRRHRPLVWASAAVLGVVAVASVVSSLLIADAYRKEKTQRIAAQNNETRATTGENRAKQQEAIAERQRDSAERSLYAANMQVASRDWISGQSGAVKAILEGQVPKPGRPDFRGWEWYYLFSQCHAWRLALPHQWLSFCWSPDGKCLATTDYIGLVNIWDAISGERKASLRGSLFRPWCLSWSPDGQNLAAGTEPGTVEIWDVGSGTKVRSLRGGGATVQALAWSPDGLKLAAGEGEGIIWGWYRGGQLVTQTGVETNKATIRIWEWRAGRVVSVLDALPGRMTTLAWHPDGRRLLAVCGYLSSSELGIWDTASGRKVAGWRPQSGESTAAFSQDGRRLVWGMEPVRVTEMVSGQVVMSTRSVNSYHATWRPGGDRLASFGGIQKLIKIWDAATGEELYSIPVDAAGAWGLSWSPKGELIAGQCPDETVRIWDTARRKIVNLGAPSDSSRPAWVAFSPDAKRLLVGAPSERPRIYDVDSGEVAAIRETRPGSLPLKLESRRETICGNGVPGPTGLVRADLRCNDGRGRSPAVPMRGRA